MERLEKLSYQAGYRFSAQVLVFASEQPITLEQAAALDGLPLHVAMQHVQLQRQDVKAAVHTGNSPVLVAVLQAARGESARDVRLAHLGLRARYSDTSTITLAQRTHHPPCPVHYPPGTLLSVCVDHLQRVSGHCGSFTCGLPQSTT